MKIKFVNEKQFFINWDSQQKKDLIDVQKAITKACQTAVKRLGKAPTPIDTGALRKSMRQQRNGSKFERIIFTELYYAVYVDSLYEAKGNEFFYKAVEQSFNIMIKELEKIIGGN